MNIVRDRWLVFFYLQMYYKPQNLNKVEADFDLQLILKFYEIAAAGPVFYETVKLVVSIFA